MRRIGMTVQGDSPRKKVFLIIGTLSGGGAEGVVIRFLREMNRDRFQPVILVFEKRGPWVVDVPTDVPVFDCGRGVGSRMMWFPRFVGHLRRERPDALISFLWFTNAVTVIARWISGVRCPLFLSERSTVLGSREGKFAELLRRAVISTLYRSATRILPNSEALRNQLVHRLGLPGDRVVTVPNPLDMERIESSSHENIEKEAGERRGSVVVGMGRLSREKGFDLLVRSISLTRHSVTLHLVGEGPEEGRLRELARELGIVERVRFAGFRRNPFPLLRGADVFVLPSRYEGFPNGLAEAMALGVPCVATRCPTGPEEIVEDGVSGILVPVEDPGAIAEAIDRLLYDPALRKRIGKAGKEKVRAYNAPRVVRKLESLIEEAVS